MSRQLLIDYIPFSMTPQQINESLMNNNGRLILSGPIQRAGIRNQNGRIYPKKILMREAKKYAETYITENRALGELDHPDCVTPDHKIFTKRGWIDIDKVTTNDFAATMNPSSMEFEWQKIERIINQSYKGEMIKIENGCINTQVTPNHKFFAKKYNRYEFIQAKELKTSNLIPYNCKNWRGEDISTFTFSGFPDHHLNRYKNDLVVDSKLFVRFLGWYISEGSCTPKAGPGGIAIWQKKESNLNEIAEILDGLNLHWNYNENGNVFYISDVRLRPYLYKLGKAQEKYIPEEIKELNIEYLELLLDAMYKGDGCGSDYYTSSSKLCDDICELFLKIGVHPSVTIREGVLKNYVIRHNKTGEILEVHNAKYYTKYKEDYDIIDVNEIFVENKELYIIRKRISEHMYVADMNFTNVEYEGNIHCVEVPNHIIYLMRGGKPFWSGNSSVINLKNVSHNILKMWWKGDDLMGQLEILTTPAGNILKELLKAGIRVGISSRGLGSVKPIGEDNTVEVQEDFEIIGWDIVSNPSTQGAFMKPITEGADELQKQLNKYVGIHKIINDILKGE